MPPDIVLLELKEALWCELECVIVLWLIFEHVDVSLIDDDDDDDDDEDNDADETLDVFNCCKFIRLFDIFVSLPSLTDNMKETQNNCLFLWGKLFL